MGLGARRYCDLYTWSHALGAHGIAHGDGAVSLAILWSGLDIEFEDEGGRTRAFDGIAKALALLPPQHWCEFHLWRERDPRAVAAYLALEAEAERKSPFTRVLRQACAEHMAPHVLTNTVALIVGRIGGPRRVRIRRALADQTAHAEALTGLASRIADGLPGGRVATVEEYLALIRKSYDGGADARLDPWLSLAEQLIIEPPRAQDRFLTIAGRRIKTLYLHLYPDARPGFVLPLVSGSLSLHVSQVVFAPSTEQALRQSERADRLAHGTIGHRGRERQLVVLRDMQGFRETVAARDLTIHRNAYILCVQWPPEHEREGLRLIRHLEGQGGRVRDDAFVQLPFFRAAQPGQGYRAPLWRPDHLAQIVAMAPAQVFRTGSRRPESLRLGMAGQAVAFDYTRQSVAHSFTVAMTGAGKGVDKIATILETYPFGVDWYLLEIGASYRWTVEALGGVYTTLDPAAAAVNPLPPRAPSGAGLDPALAAATLNSLAFLLTDGRTLLDVHESAAGAAALTALYGPDAPTRDPGLVDLLKALESLTLERAEPTRAARAMAANLHSFLETPEGRIFAERDNVSLSPGISGVDLKEVDRASPKLLTFYLVFLCLRFLHLAFTGPRPARVLLDEIHRFVAHAPDVLRRLVSEIARMGRKEAAAIDIVTQGLAEIDVLEPEVVNSMPYRSLLYRADGWDEIARRIGMPAPALALWRGLPFPLALDWRPAIRSVASQYFALRLTFPRLLLALADTTPEGLALKARIARETADPLLRLERFLKSSP